MAAAARVGINQYKIHQQFLGTRMNKINLRKEFFRVSLSEIRQAVEKLDPRKDLKGTVTWTEKAKAQQYFDSLHIDSDSQVKEKWFSVAQARARLFAERRERAFLKAQSLSESEDGVNGESA